EPGVPANDQRLAAAVCRAGNVVLPLLREEVTSYSQPDAKMLPLLDCAKGLGHINVEADSDGIVRSLFLREGPPDNMAPQLAWIAYTASG
ncbi:CHASE2 domain-containing protein, partial [Salmonella enterica subsp. enterica]